MPAQKGRKRRQARERRREHDVSAPSAPVAPAPPVAARRKQGRAPAAGPLPSTTARVTGLMIAVITAVLAALMVYQSVSGDASGIDGAARIVGGVALVVLAVVVGVLSVAPGAVRDWFARRR